MLRFNCLQPQHLLARPLPILLCSSQHHQPFLYQGMPGCCRQCLLSCICGWAQVPQRSSKSASIHPEQRVARVQLGSCAVGFKGSLGLALEGGKVFKDQEMQPGEVGVGLWSICIKQLHVMGREPVPDQGFAWTTKQFPLTPSTQPIAGAQCL